MLLHSTHLSYCTNIHSGESWEDVFESLTTYVLPIKRNLSPDKPFGIGLRLSDEASRTLIESDALHHFKLWLDQHQLYVFTMNGFPYGGFHGTIVKDAVHKPDWTTQKRTDYTIRLCNILAFLLPEGIEGGISTSPISYKPWYLSDAKAIDTVYTSACNNMLKVIKVLHGIKFKTGKSIHIDIEPEPDGLLENTEETISFFNQHLIPAGLELFAQEANLSAVDAEELIKQHLQVCYDVCHFAIEYEEPATVFKRFAQEGIKIGKIQISAALKANLSKDRIEIQKELYPFIESTYLHQVIARDASHNLFHYTDLSIAMEDLFHTKATEWRTHFHVPIFVQAYGQLESTQDEIIQVLTLHKEHPVTNHLEIETYTWEVLPPELKIPLQKSIERELLWVMEHL